MVPPPTMKAINFPPAPTYSQPSPVSSLKLNGSHTTPTPSATQLLIRNHAAGITPYELTWPSPSPVRPHIPCYDVAGTVVSAPPDSKFALGDRVMSLLPWDGPGGMSEYSAVDESWVAPIPERLSFVDAASVPKAALTVIQSIEAHGALREGMSVLVTGATGAVGRMFIQILSHRVGRSGKIIAIGGTGSNGLKELGADVVINYREVKEWDGVVRKEVGKVDSVFDCVGGETLERCVELVKGGGKILTIASPPPVWAELKDWKEAETRGVTGHFFIVTSSGEQLREIAGWIESGILKTSVGYVADGLTEEGVQEAWSRGLKGGLAGSAVVKIV